MDLRCPNVQCQGPGSDKAGSIIRYGFYKTKRGRQRRFRCRICGLKATQLQRCIRRYAGENSFCDRFH